MYYIYMFMGMVQTIASTTVQSTTLCVTPLIVSQIGQLALKFAIMSDLFVRCNKNGR